MIIILITDNILWTGSLQRPKSWRGQAFGLPIVQRFDPACSIRFDHCLQMRQLCHSTYSVCRELLFNFFELFNLHYVKELRSFEHGSALMQSVDLCKF